MIGFSKPTNQPTKKKERNSKQASMKASLFLRSTAALVGRGEERERKVERLARGELDERHEEVEARNEEPRGAGPARPPNEDAEHVVAKRSAQIVVVVVVDQVLLRR